MIRSMTLTAVALAVVLAGAPATQAATRNGPSTPCFFVTEWRGWKAPNPSTLYIGVNFKDIYEVDLTSGSPELMWPDMHLVSINRGSSSICSALDLDLKIADTNGFSTPLIAKSMRKLSPEEVAAVPPKYRPN